MSDIQTSSFRNDSQSKKSKNPTKIFSLKNENGIKEDTQITQARLWLREKEAFDLKKREFLKKYLNREYFISKEQIRNAISSFPKYTFDFNGKPLLINPKIQIKTTEYCKPL